LNRFPALTPDKWFHESHNLAWVCNFIGLPHGNTVVILSAGRFLPAVVNAGPVIGKSDRSY